MLLDLDHTVFDSDTSEAVAFERTLRAAGLDHPDEHFATYDRINRALWAGVEQGTVDPNDVRLLRFQRLVDDVGLDADPVWLADEFVAGLGAHGELLPGAEAMLDLLDSMTSLAMVTNGIGEVQRTRIERLRLAKYFDAIVISGEVGVSKPGRRIFDLTFELLGHPSRASTVMVGDSLTSDIAGGAGYGIPTCWYNPSRRPRPEGHGVTHEIHDLAELPPLVSGRTAEQVDR